MMRQLSALSELEQDYLFYSALERLKNQEMSNLLAMLYLAPRTKKEIGDSYPSYSRGIDAIKRMRLQGVNIEYKDSLYWLIGIDDGEDEFMVVKNTYAPHIKVAL